MKRQKKALLIGMSHVVAVQKSLAKQPFDWIDIIDLNARENLFNNNTNKIYWSKIDKSYYSNVFLSLRGQYHNVMGLVENPVPFSTGECEKGLVPAVSSAESRILIPSQVLQDHIDNEISDLQLALIDQAVEYFGQHGTAIVNSPPPILSEKHILEHPGIFRAKLRNGITPSSLRARIYELYTNVIENRAKKLGIGMIYAPEDSRDADGGLKLEMRSQDPTHANENYGALVADQIRNWVDRHA